MLYGYAGTLHFKVITRGKAAHTANPWRGVNAILKMEKVIRALTRVQQELTQRPSRVEGMKYTTLNLGTIRGGAKASIVPDYCELEVDARLVPEDRSDFILDRVKGEIGKIRDCDPDFIYELQVIRKNEAYHSDPNSELVRAVQDSLVSAGYCQVPIPVTMSRGGSDMKFFVPRGIPCVAFGAGHRSESNIHGADENLRVEDFLLASKATAAALAKLLEIR
jgi:acetylornithine deacetylase/succinyl-diaminopimelate desuccinylase-like protein